MALCEAGFVSVCVCVYQEPVRSGDLCLCVWICVSVSVRNLDHHGSDLVPTSDLLGAGETNTAKEQGVVHNARKTLKHTLTHRRT